MSYMKYTLYWVLGLILFSIFMIYFYFALFSQKTYEQNKNLKYQILNTIIFIEFMEILDGIMEEKVWLYFF